MGDRKNQAELVRENAAVCLDTDTVLFLLNGLPFAVGAEYVNAHWIEAVFKKLQEVYKLELKRNNGTVELYLTEKNQNLRVPGRLFFILLKTGRLIFHLRL